MPSVRREVVLPLPRERAWELLTDEAALREWLAEDAELEAEPGGAVRADDREGVVEDRFTLLAPDAYREDYLEIALWDAKATELARESLYEDDSEG